MAEAILRASRVAAKTTSLGRDKLSNERATLFVALLSSLAETNTGIVSAIYLYRVVTR